MPDLQSELSKVIDQWEEPEMPTHTPAPNNPFQATVNVARTAFDAVLKNPGKSRRELTAMLVAQGFNKNSVTSLLIQMLRQGRIKEENGGVYSLVPEYIPLQTYAAFKNRLAREAAAAAKAESKAKRKYVRKNAAAKAAAYEAHENYNPTATAQVVPHKELSAEDWVNSLTLKQAKAVYEELKKVFG